MVLFEFPPCAPLESALEVTARAWLPVWTALMSSLDHGFVGVGLQPFDGRRAGFLPGRFFLGRRNVDLHPGLAQLLHREILGRTHGATCRDRRFTTGLVECFLQLGRKALQEFLAGDEICRAEHVPVEHVILLHFLKGAAQDRDRGVLLAVDHTGLKRRIQLHPGDRCRRCTGRLHGFHVDGAVHGPDLEAVHVGGCLHHPLAVRKVAESAVLIGSEHPQPALRCHVVEHLLAERAIEDVVGLEHILEHVRRRHHLDVLVKWRDTAVGRSPRPEISGQHLLEIRLDVAQPAVGIELKR